MHKAWLRPAVASPPLFSSALPGRLPCPTRGAQPGDRLFRLCSGKLEKWYCITLVRRGLGFTLYPRTSSTSTLSAQTGGHLAARSQTEEKGGTRVGFIQSRVQLPFNCTFTVCVELHLIPFWFVVMKSLSSLNESGRSLYHRHEPWIHTPSHSQMCNDSHWQWP